jgi:ATP-dependent Zn protease
MSNLTKNIIWAVVTLVALALIFSFFAGSQPQPQTISLNDLVAKINAGGVKQIKVNGNELDITMKDGSAAIAQKETEAGVSETLKNLNVDPTALQGVDLQIETPSGWEFWAGILITPILTLVAFGFLFWLMFRQAKTGEPGI